jgi:sugar O-acyltransferase (sialic acid O-acetyltransferase NeuD family)
MKRIAIVGSSGHARVVIDIVRRQGEFTIEGLIDRFRGIGEQTLGVPVLGAEEDLPELAEARSLSGVIVAIGDNHVRAQVAEKVARLCPDLPWVSAIHPSAEIGLQATIGAGTVVMPGAVVNACASVGRCCIVNTRACLDHDSTLEDFASLAPGVVTGGNCRIGRYSAIGIGAVLVHGVTVGQHVVIGAASLVTHAIGDNVVAYGSPARVVRQRAAGDRYL